MTHGHFGLRFRRLAACAFALGAMVGFAGHHANAAEAQLVLAKTGWLYVGGHVTTIDNKQYTVGQMYAEYMIPAKQTHPYPVVMVHGGTMSGTNYTGTPDGREGWAQFFARTEARIGLSIDGPADLHDASRRTLVVELSSGTFEYQGISADLWRRFSGASSPWSFYRDNIEEEYAGKRVR